MPRARWSSSTAPRSSVSRAVSALRGPRAIREIKDRLGLTVRPVSRDPKAPPVLPELMAILDLQALRVLTRPSLGPKAHPAIRDLWVLPGPMVLRVRKVLRPPSPDQKDRVASPVRRVIRGLKARLAPKDRQG